MSHRARLVGLGVLVGTLMSVAALMARADPPGVRALLLTVAFDNTTGEVTKFYVNGFPDVETCTNKSMAIAAVAEERAGAGTHVGMSLCFSDATVYGGKSKPHLMIPPGEKLVPKIPDDAPKGPITNMSSRADTLVIHGSSCAVYENQCAKLHQFGDPVCFCADL